MKNAGKDIIAIAAQDGLNVSVVGDTYRIVMTGKQTDGAYAVIDMLVPPGGGPGPHAHADFQEAFYVMDGEIEVKSEFQTYMATKGAFVNIPLGGVVHQFKNKSDTTAHLLCIVTPSGLEEFFQEIGKLVAAGQFLPPPTMNPDEQQRLQRIAEKHGQKLYPPDYLDK